ncbi:MAG: hypothetical protein AB1424_04360 [Thermodesulfobacteriota bacterium]
MGPKVNLNKSPSRMEIIKDVTTIIQSVLTIIAIIGAAIWFIMRAEANPKANISHTLEHEKITDKWTWVHVGVIISNPGVRRLELRHGTFRIQGIMPLADMIKEKIEKGEAIIPKDDGIVKWPTIGKIYVDDNQKREVICENEYENRDINIDIDPGESQKLIVEFLIPSFVKAVRIYSHVYRDQSSWEKVKYFMGLEKMEKYGWYEVSIYDLKKIED